MGLLKQQPWLLLKFIYRFRLAVREPQSYELVVW